MASLAWLLIPLLAAVGAGLWGSWAARNRRSGRTGDTSELNGYAAFREAMEKTRGGPERPQGASAPHEAAAHHEAAPHQDVVDVPRADVDEPHPLTDTDAAAAVAAEESHGIREKSHTGT
ncbi:hypothetical protein AB0C93_08880 [Streptomyces sp. NPDC048518]|uniref:hypothetical protein n=1 Tax=Streptomyces sp. NPDC048518 TaxID=3155029 RepID=UPI0033D70DC9